MNTYAMVDHINGEQITYIVTAGSREVALTFLQEYAASRGKEPPEDMDDIHELNLGVTGVIFDSWRDKHSPGILKASKCSKCDRVTEETYRDGMCIQCWPSGA